MDPNMKNMKNVLIFCTTLMSELKNEKKSTMDAKNKINKEYLLV
jgi:hypothetical protein